MRRKLWKNTQFKYKTMFIKLSSLYIEKDAACRGFSLIITDRTAALGDFYITKINLISFCLTNLAEVQLHKGEFVTCVFEI